MLAHGRSMIPTIKNRVFAFSILVSIAAAATISTTTPQLLFQQQAKAQGKQTLIQGELTAASGGKPSGGERIGSYAITEQSNSLLSVLVGMEKSPSAGKVFKAWLVDTNTNSYLNLGQTGPDGKLSYSANIHPLVYNQILVSEEPPDSPVSKPSQIIGGAPIHIE